MSVTKCNCKTGGGTPIFCEGHDALVNRYHKSTMRADLIPADDENEPALDGSVLSVSVVTDDFDVDDFGWIISDDDLELVFVVAVVELVTGVLDAGVL